MTFTGNKWHQNPIFDFITHRFTGSIQYGITPNRIASFRTDERVLRTSFLTHRYHFRSLMGLRHWLHLLATQATPLYAASNLPLQPGYKVRKLQTKVSDWQLGLHCGTKLRYLLDKFSFSYQSTYALSVYGQLCFWLWI